MDNKCSREVYCEVSIFFATGDDVKNRDQSGRSNGIWKYFGEQLRKFYLLNASYKSWDHYYLIQANQDLTF